MTQKRIKRSGFRDSVKVKRLRQIGAKIVQDSKAQAEDGLQSAI